MDTPEGRYRPIDQVARRSPHFAYHAENGRDRRRQTAKSRDGAGGREASLGSRRAAARRARADRVGAAHGLAHARDPPAGPPAVDLARGRRLRGRRLRAGDDRRLSGRLRAFRTLVCRRGPRRAAGPETVTWLAAHWGTQCLRHVEVRPGRPGRRLPAGHAVIGYGFFTEGETPQAAMSALASSWPELRFLLRPVPPD